MGRVIKSKTWKTIEIAIEEYPENKKKLSTLLDDIVYSKGSSSGKTNFDTEYSKPQSMTESKALKLQSGYYQRLKKKVTAVESVYKSLSKSEKEVIAKRFWSDPERKLSYIKIDSGYSERQMKRIVYKTIYQVGLILGEIEETS